SRRTHPGNDCCRCATGTKRADQRRSGNRRRYWPGASVHGEDTAAHRVTVMRKKTGIRYLELQPKLEARSWKFEIPQTLMSTNRSQPALSYDHGADSTPLLGQTIGENLRATMERHGEREALVVRSQNYRATYRQLWDATTRAARALLSA